MGEYESHVLCELMAEGDLASCHRLICALSKELEARILLVRNPRQRHSLWRLQERLADAAVLSENWGAGTEGDIPAVDPQEVLLCAAEVAGSGDSARLERMLRVLADELKLNAERIGVPWMIETAEVLHGVESGERFPEFPWGAAPAGHRAIRTVALLLLAGVSLMAAANFAWLIRH